MANRMNPEKEILAKFLTKEIRTQQIYLTGTERRKLTREAAEILKLKNQITDSLMMFKTTKLPTQRTTAKT